MVKILTFIIIALLLCSTSINAQSIVEVQQLISRNKLDAAYSMIENLLQKQPSNSSLLTEKARVLVLQEKYAQAEVVANSILKINDKNKVALNVRGIVKRDSKKQYAEALQDFNKALALDPAYIPALSNKAITLYQGKLGKKSEVLDVVSYAIEVNPENTLLRGIRGNLLNQAGNYKLALMDLNKAVKVNNPLPYLTDRANALMYLGLYKEALQDVTQVLKSQPHHLQAAVIQTYCQYVESKTTESRNSAITEAKNILAQNHQNYLLYLMIGHDEHIQKKNVEAAYSNYSKAYSLAPNQPLVMDLLYNLLNKNKELTQNNATAQQKYLELSKKVELYFRKQLNIKKEAIKEEAWNFKFYENLNNTWEDLISFIEKDNRLNADKANSKKEIKNKYEFWRNGLPSNAPNCCWGYMQTKFLGYTQEGLYDPNNRASDATKVEFLKKQLATYDGKNGAECASRIALWIADIYQTPYSRIKNFDLAKQYAEKAKSIKDDVEDDPNSISGIATTAKESLANTQYWKEEDDAWKMELEAMKQNSSSSESGSTNTYKNMPNADPNKVAAAISAYERIHPQIERLASSIVSTTSKVQKGGNFSFLLGKERESISRRQREMVNIYYAFMEQHGKYLPRSLSSHLKSDISKSASIRNDYITGQASSNYYDDDDD